MVAAYEFLTDYLEKLSKERRSVFHLNEGIQDNEINEMLKKLELILPKDFLIFYQFSYGAVLEELKILNPIEINDFRNELREIHEESIKDSIIPFAFISGTGDFFSFELNNENEYKILDCFHEFPPNKWVEICNSFRVWLKKFLENDLEPYWLE